MKDGGKVRGMKEELRSLARDFGGDTAAKAERRKGKG
jgi:hypothetical protein